MPTLLEAITSGPPTVVIVGMSPILRPHDDRNKKLPKWLVPEEKFIERLNERYNAQWRKPLVAFLGAQRYTSLEDVFTTAFVNRYHGKAIQSRGSSERSSDDDMFSSLLFSRSRRKTSRSDNSFPLIDRSSYKFQFKRALRVAATQIPPILRDAPDDERKRRVFLANMWLCGVSGDSRTQKASSGQNPVISIPCKAERFPLPFQATHSSYARFISHPQARLSQREHSR